MLNCFQEVFNGVIYSKHCIDRNLIQQRFNAYVDTINRNMINEVLVYLWYSQALNIL